MALLGRRRIRDLSGCSARAGALPERLQSCNSAAGLRGALAECGCRLLQDVRPAQPRISEASAMGIWRRAPAAIDQAAWRAERGTLETSFCRPAGRRSLR